MRQKLFILAFAIGFVSNASAETVLPKAFYEVPVKNSRLKKFAKFELAGIERVETPDQVEVRYVLPLELTGEPNEVVFSGRAEQGKDSYTLNGPNGTMSCSSGPNKSCSVQFKNLRINEDVRFQILQDRSLSTRELRSRLSVARDFSGDPGGILTYNIQYQ